MSGSDNKLPTVNCSDGGNPVRGIQFPLGRSRNGLRQRRIKGLSNPNSSPAAAICGGRGGWGVYCCFRQPRTSGSPEESPTNDPNNPKFSYGSLKALIEKNDFYSRDCNPYFKSSPDCTE